MTNLKEGMLWKYILIWNCFFACKKKKERKKSNLTFNHIRIKFEVRKYFIRPKLQPVYFGSRADATCKRCQRTKDRKAATSWSTCGRLVGFLYCLQLISTSEKKIQCNYQATIDFFGFVFKVRYHHGLWILKTYASILL